MRIKHEANQYDWLFQLDSQELLQEKSLRSDEDEEDLSERMKLKQAIDSWIPLASENEDPSRERVDEPWNEVTDDDE